MAILWDDSAGQQSNNSTIQWDEPTATKSRTYGDIIDKPQSMLDDALRVPGVYARSASKLIGGTLDALGHPADTLKGAAQALTHPIDAIKGYVKDRYDSPENIGHTLTNDPFGVIADASVVGAGGGKALLEAGGSAAAKGARQIAVGAGKYADAIEGKKFDTLTKSRVALDGVKRVSNELGKAVSDKFTSPLGDTPVAKTTFQDIVKTIPPPIQKSFKIALEQGSFDLAPDGSVISNVRNAHTARRIFSEAVGESGFQDVEGSSQYKKIAYAASNNLGKLINETTPQVRAVNGPYHLFQEVSNPIVDQSVDKWNRPNLTNINKMALDKTGSANAQDFKELRRQVPEVDDLYKTLKKEARSRAIKNTAVWALKRVSDLGELKATFPRIHSAE